MQALLPITAKPLSSQIFIDSSGNLWTGRTGMYYNISTSGGSVGNFITTDTFQQVGANKDWLGIHHFDGQVSIPQEAPEFPVEGKAYIWLGDGNSSTDPEGFELPIASMATLGGVKLSADFNIDSEGVLTIAATGIPTNLTLGTRTGTHMPILNSNGMGVVLPSADALNAGLMTAAAFNKLESLGLYTGKDGITVLSGTKEITPNYGMAANTVAQGNDPRIVNAVPNSRLVLTGAGLQGGGNLTIDRAISVLFGQVANTVAQGNDPRILAGQISADNPLNLGKVLDNRRDSGFEYGMNGITAYPNATNTSMTRMVDSLSPTGRVIQFVSTGWSQANVRIPFANLSTQSAPSKVFLVKIIAKIPIGWSIYDTHNDAGFSSKIIWLTSKDGTGLFQEYILKVVCGNTGVFSTINFFDLRKTTSGTSNPSTSNPVTSQIAFAEVMDLTESFYKTRFRISLTAPASPLPGDFWIE